MSRFYTVAEANARLPELIPLLSEMRVQSEYLEALQKRAAELQRKVRGNGHHNPIEDRAMAQGLKQIEDALRQGVEQLAEWSIELKDLRLGLVDFPALREGRTVYLCWQLGEPEVAFWHETTTGFAGRQPIDDKLT